MGLTPSSSEGGSGLPSQWTTDANGNLIITSDSTRASGTNVLTVKNATGDTLERLAADGTVRFDGGSSTREWRASVGGTRRLSLQDETFTLVARGGASGFEQAYDGVTDGLYFMGLNAAIDSDYLSPGYFSLWLDQTNGAVKLMVKAKSANGTVATAAIALA